MIAQSNPLQTIPTSIDSKLILDAAGPEQRKSIGNVYLIGCPLGQGMLGTGFLIEGGLMVTNAHVTAACDESNLIGVNARNERISFSRVIKDQKRDLALLIPSIKLAGGLALASNENVLPGTTVSTWGYPFIYNGVSPLLSVGYISGYREAESQGLMVKHIIVNGAFNHGNSGGPLLISQRSEVIGIVVLTYNFYPPEIRQIIDGLSSQKSGLTIGTMKKPDGGTVVLNEPQVTGIVLDEFYNKTQVMIGEAISVSELKKVITEHSAEVAHLAAHNPAKQSK